MSKAKPGTKQVTHLILDTAKPMEVRAHTLVSALTSTDLATAMNFARTLLGEIKVQSPTAELEKLKQKYEQTINELQQGGLRSAAFIGQADMTLPGLQPRVHVVTHDGQHRYVLLGPGINVDDLKAGYTTFLDAKGNVVLGYSDQIPVAGPQATFVRLIPGTRQVELSIRDERATFYASDILLAAIDQGEINNGDRALISPNQEFAFSKIPNDTDRRSRFVDRSKPPNIDPSRDIGRPHSCLAWLVARTRTLMFREDLIEQYGLRRRVSLLMLGPSGTGKTMTIQGFLTLFRQMTVERTGREDLESRVVRVKLSEQLSEWLGRSEKNWDALFDDIIQLASTPVETADGDPIILPIVICLEEVEAAARRRSDGLNDANGGVMDRILSTILQRFDDALDVISHLPIIFISTSNRGDMIDGAMFRRLGAKVARFKRLDRDGLAAVLDKKVKPEYPFTASNGSSQTELRQQLIDEVVSDIFSPLGDDGTRLELTLRDGTKLTRRVRDFLTGAIIEQSLSEAIDSLVFFADRTGRNDVGLDGQIVTAALRRQIENLMQNVTPMNVADYVDVPEHTPVANVRRIAGANGHLGQLLRPHG